jgi:hypothetical protein
MKVRLTALAAVAAALTVPATASAATLAVEPRLPCYGSGHNVNLLGTGFSPNLMSGIAVTKDGESIGALSTDATGAFNGSLRLGQPSGRRTSTYTATDTTNPTLTASTQITVSEADVGLQPRSGSPGRRVRIKAVGFTAGGKRLWAHVTRAGKTRNTAVGRLRGACKRLTKRRRLLPRNTPIGVYIIQFDAFRKYRARRAQSVGFTITVRRVRRPSTASAARLTGWSRVY